jgi:hypothetical protein
MNDVAAFSKSVDGLGQAELRTTDSAAVGNPQDPHLQILTHDPRSVGPPRPDVSSIDRP